MSGIPDIGVWVSCAHGFRFNFSANKLDCVQNEYQKSVYHYRMDRRGFSTTSLFCGHAFEIYLGRPTDGENCWNGSRSTFCTVYARRDHSVFRTELVWQKTWTCFSSIFSPLRNFHLRTQIPLIRKI